MKGSSDNEAGDVPLYWRITCDGVAVAEGQGSTITFTPEKPGKYHVQLSSDHGFSAASTASAITLVESDDQRDRRFTEFATGSWLYSDEECVYVLRLHSNGTLNLREQIKAGGIADALASASQHDMGELKGEWWIKNGELCLRPTGVEHPVWNIWVRTVDTLFSGDLGKVQQCEMWIDDSTLAIRGGFTDGRYTELTRITPAQ